MSTRLKGSFNIYTVIPVFKDASDWRCDGIYNKQHTFIDRSQSDLDIIIKNVFEAEECQAVIIVHKAFAHGELRTFIDYINCDEKVLIELLKKGLLRELIL